MTEIWLLASAHLALAFVIAYAAAQKGRDAVSYFLFALVFTFPVAILVLIAVPERRAQMPGFTACGRCQEGIPGSAARCSHCGELNMQLDSGCRGVLPPIGKPADGW